MCFPLRVYPFGLSLKKGTLVSVLDLSLKA